MDSGRRCVIIAGGDPPDKFDILDDDFIIACDRGLLYAEDAGISPDVILGDFDSLGAEVPDRCEVLRYPEEKDDTDLMLAIKFSLSKGFRDFLLLGVYGGRMDHFIGNIQAAAYAASKGAVCHLSGKGEDAYVMSGGSMEIRNPGGRDFSMFSLSDRCTGIRLEGMKYKADGITITNTFPIGVSNEFTEETARVSLETGILLIMLSVPQPKIRT
ncbi:MAG: thiamine diphosphokinase [Oscillospiraceae bacterium]|jgi:thiamine pyrophosphokinase